MSPLTNTLIGMVQIQIEFGCWDNYINNFEKAGLELPPNSNSSICNMLGMFRKEMRGGPKNRSHRSTLLSM